MIKYQRAEFPGLSGGPILAIEVTRETDHSYTAMVPTFDGGTKEVRRMKRSNPPLFDSWHEAREDLIRHWQARMRGAGHSLQDAFEELDKAMRLQPSKEVSE